MALCWNCTRDWYPFVNESAFIPLPAPATTSLVSKTMSSSCSLAPVWTVLVDRLPTLERRKHWCMGSTSPRMICTRCTTTHTSWARSPCSTSSRRLFFFFYCFEPGLDNQWRLSNWSWKEICFCCSFYHSNCSFLNEFRWIVSRFDLCNSAEMRKDCVCNCFLMSLTKAHVR